MDWSCADQLSMICSTNLVVIIPSQKYRLWRVVDLTEKKEGRYIIASFRRTKRKEIRKMETEPVFVLKVVGTVEAGLMVLPG